jgi:hypothetical protein
MGDFFTLLFPIFGAFIGASAAGWLQLHKSREERRSQRMVEAYREVAPVIEQVRRYAGRAIDWADTAPTDANAILNADEDHPDEVLERIRRKAMNLAFSHPPEMSTAAAALFGSEAFRQLLDDLGRAYSDLQIAEGHEAVWIAEEPDEEQLRSWRHDQRSKAQRCISLCDQVRDLMVKELRADLKPTLRRSRVATFHKTAS